MTAHGQVTHEDRISAQAMRLADDFLASARRAILELSEGDLDQLHRAAVALRANATDRSTPEKSCEHVAYALVASAFNEALGRRNHRP